MIALTAQATGPSPSSPPCYLLKEPNGEEKIRDMIRDDIREALKRDDRIHARELLMTLRHFLDVHPSAKSRK